MRAVSQSASEIETHFLFEFRIYLILISFERHPTYVPSNTSQIYIDSDSSGNSEDIFIVL